MDNILIYGGTFDPIHNGHIAVAINVQKQFNFKRFIFLPCKLPVLKSPAIASPKQRIDMIKLALKTQAKAYHFEIDPSEINRDTPSYMVDTLKQFRQQLGHTSITLLLGEDSFNQLHQWYQWEKLLELTNLLVIARPNDTSSSPLLSELRANHETHDYTQLTKSTHGLIYYYNAGLFEISSTEIREQLINKFSSIALPKAVYEYIKDNKLY